MKSYTLDEKGRRDIVNWFGLETEDSGEVLIWMNVISCNTDWKLINREAYDIKWEEKKQELHRIIMNERVKHIWKKQQDGALKAPYSDEESDMPLSDEGRQHIIEGPTGLI